MAEIIHVIGHKNPDTDSICSAIALARLKERLGTIGATPFRAGNLNRESEYVLNYFQVPTPEYLPDLYLRAKDLLNREVPLVLPETPLREALLIMQQNGHKTLPVVNASQQLLGIITIGDIAQAYIGNMGILDFGTLKVTVRNVLHTLNGTLYAGEKSSTLRGQVHVGAMLPEALEEVLEPGNILFVGNREDVQRTALRVGVSTLILTGGASLSAELLAEAEQKGIVVITVQHDTFTAARLLPMSIPIGSIMKTEGIVAFQDDDLITDVKKTMLETRFRNYPVTDDDQRVMGLITRYDLLGMRRKQAILVDHNEWGQAVTGAEQAQILEIMDHHRVGGIQTGEPILFRNEPVGSTCTLVAQSYREYGLVPETAMAGIMLAGILSDTVLFKSPTCTDRDRETALWLETIAGLDAQSFGLAMFKAASDLSDFTPLQLIEADLKTFSIGGDKVGIGQVSVMGTEGLTKMRIDLQRNLDQLRIQQNLRYLLLMVTDLIAESTELFITGEDPDDIAKAFGKTLQHGSVILPGVLSRKKQVVPPLTKYFQV